MTADTWISSRTCWVVTDGSQGMDSQGLGLAEAVGLTPILKHISVRVPWRRLPPSLWIRPLAALDPRGDRLEPPWPDVLITCGKRSVAPAIAVRRASGGKTLTVHIQDPQVKPEKFDLVVAPAHDRLAGRNVLTTLTAIHRVTPAKLSAAAERFGPDLAPLPRPLVAVLIGGSTSRGSLTAADVRALAARLAAMSRQHGAGLAVTPSRRTGEANTQVLCEALRDCPAAVWDGTGENPYFGYLALADAIVVTTDSVSMVSEACSTGKPVYVLEIDGTSGRIAAFHRALQEAGVTRPFDGGLETWTYRVPNDTAAAADAVLDLLQARRAA